MIRNEESSSGVTDVEDTTGDFDAALFAGISCGVGIPAVVSVIVSFLILRRVLYKVSRIKSWLVLKSWAPLMGNILKFKLLYYVFVFLLCLLPLLLCVIWGLLTTVIISPLLIGISLLIFPLVFIFLIYSLSYWKAAHFRMTRWPMGWLIVSFFLFSIYIILTSIVFIDPFSFRAVASIFLSFNFMALSRAIYILQKEDKYVDFEKIILLSAKEEGDLKDAVQEDRSLRKRKLVKAGIYYSLSILFLIIFAILVKSKLDTFLGWVFLGTFVVLDISVFLIFVWKTVSAEQRPLRVLLLCAILRVLVVLFGGVYWIACLALIFLLFGGFLAKRMMKQYFPSEKKKEELLVPHFEVEEEKPSDGTTANEENAAQPGRVRKIALKLEGYTEKAAGALKASITAHRYLWVLVFLSICFFIVIYVARKSDSIPADKWKWYGSDKKYRQETVAFVSIFIVYIFAFLCGVVELIQRRREFESAGKVNKKDTIFIYVFSGIAYLLAILCGVFVYAEEDFMTLLMLAFFLPLIFVVAVSFLMMWRKNDCSILEPLQKRPTQWPQHALLFCNRSETSTAVVAPGTKDVEAPVTQSEPTRKGAKRKQKRSLRVVLTPNSPQDSAAIVAFFRGGLTKRDCKALVVWFALILLIILFGLIMSLAIEPHFIGWISAFVVAIAIWTIFCLAKWIITETVTLWFVVSSTCLSIVVLVFMALVLMYPLADSDAWLMIVCIFSVVFYFTLIAFGLSVRRFREEDWKKFMIFPAIGVGLFVLVVVTLFLSIGLYVSPLIGFGMLFLLLFLALVGITILILKKKKKRMPNVFTWRNLIFVLIFVGILLLAAALILKSPFLGITVAFACIFVVLLLRAFKQLISFDSSFLRYSQHMFPVYFFNKEKDTIEERNGGTAAVFACSLLLTLWGVLASMFYEPASVGTGVAVFGLMIGVVFATDRMSQSEKEFVDAMGYVSSTVLHGLRKKAYDAELTEEIGDDEESGDSYSHASLSELRKILWEKDKSSGIPAVVTDVDGIKSIHEELLTLDRHVSQCYGKEQRFRVYFQFLIINSARFQKKQQRLELKDFLKQMDEYRDISTSQLDSFLSGLSKEEKKRLVSMYEKYREREEGRKRAEREKAEEETAAAKTRAYRIVKQRDYTPEEQELKENIAEILKGKKSVIDETVKKLKEDWRKQNPGKSDEDMSLDDHLDARIAVVEMRAHMDSITETCKKLGKSFVDPDFPPNPSSLYVDENALHGSNVSQWRRITDVIPNDRHLFGDGADPGDIMQGGLGDCWFLSAMAVVARDDKKIRALFIGQEFNDTGVYGVRFFKDGEWVSSFVDDYIPCTGNGSPAYVYGKDETEFWAMIMEKAYAKLHGSYQAIEAGLVHFGLVDLTGGAGDMIKLDDVEEDVASGVLWKKILKYHQMGYLLGTGSPSGSDADISDYGIVQGHAYSILDVVEVDGHNLMRLRNPWGGEEWTGDWSDQSELWTKKLQKRLRHADEDDGDFWMSFDDFVRHYASIYLCKVFDSSWSKAVVESAWKGDSAGGRYSLPTGSNNPQFLLTLRMNDPQKVMLILEQEEARGLDRDYHHITLIVLKKGGKRVKKPKRSELVAMSGSFTNSRAVTIDAELEPNVPYTLYPCTYDSGLEASFRILVYCEGERCSLERIPDDVEAT